jgi:hypothetical protein
MTRERLTQEAAMLGQHIGIPVTELVEQPRRALYVGEEERDGTCWKISHRGSISRGATYSKQAKA